MEKEQLLEWEEAQKILISEDLVALAKRQLQFLAAVDRKRWLYEGPALQRAIYRYNACWLPLLARYSEFQVSEGPLVVPLDCEWVWHCHRLNPVRYKSDCEEFYGRILDNKNVVSSLQGTSRRETEEIWNKQYPQEPYDFVLARAFSNDISENVNGGQNCTNYNLVLAVERQSPFFYQVSRPHLNNDLFLEGAVARYKGFLHLIRRNRERSLKRFCVPTYDIDLIWHSHQLNPASYCSDLVELLGKVLEHDDTDSDRTKGKKLDTGFSETTRQWENTFGSRYWRAGSMYRGSAPSPVAVTPFTSNAVTKKVVSTNGYKKLVDLPETKIIEVLLEFVEIKNFPKGYKGSFNILFSKTPHDAIFNVKRSLNILSESGEKQVALFNCQPSGYLFFELVFQASSNLPVSRAAKTLASSFISLEEFLAPVSKLSIDKWLEMVPSCGVVSPQPISVRVAASFTTPILTPHVLKMVRSQPFFRSSCFFPIPEKMQVAKSWTRVTDEAGNEVIRLQMRDLRKAKGIDSKMMRKEVMGITRSGETCTLAQYSGAEWSLVDSQWSLKLQKKKDSHIELTGDQMVKLVPGRKLEFQPKQCEKQRHENDFMTAVEFSSENPYGRAVALLDLKGGLFKVREEWLALPGITLAFIISYTLRKEGYNGLVCNDENLKQSGHFIQEAALKTHLTSPAAKEVAPNHQNINAGVAIGNKVVPEKGGACSGGCGSGGCGGCGAGCGNKLESGGCGGCGAGCGNKLESGGCGGCGAGCGGCGAGCGNKLESGGCGGCGTGCGNKLESSGCGGGCGDSLAHGTGNGCGGSGGCGDSLAHGTSNLGPSVAQANNALVA